MPGIVVLRDRDFAGEAFRKELYVRYIGLTVELRHSHRTGMGEFKGRTSIVSDPAIIWSHLDQRVHSVRVKIGQVIQ